MAKLDEDRETRLYREYITDTLFYQAQNQRVTVRWCETMEQKKEEQSAQEIVDSVMLSAGLTLKED